MVVLKHRKGALQYTHFKAMQGGTANVVLKYRGWRNKCCHIKALQSGAQIL